MNKYLIKLANHLDKKGLHKEADYVDWILRKRAEDVMAGLSEFDAQALKRALNDVMATETITKSDFLKAKDRSALPGEFARFKSACALIGKKEIESEGVKLKCYDKGGLKCIKMKLKKYQFEVCAKESMQEDKSTKQTMSFLRLADIAEETKGSGF